MQRAPIPAVHGVYVRFEQKQHRLNVKRCVRRSVRVVKRDVQAVSVLGVLEVGVSSALQQNPDNVQLFELDGDVQRSRALAHLSVQISPCLDQQADRLNAFPFNRLLYGKLVVTVPHIDVRAFAYQFAQEPRAILNEQHQRRVAEEVPLVDVEPLPEDHSHHVFVLARRHHVQEVLQAFRAVLFVALCPVEVEDEVFFLLDADGEEVVGRRQGGLRVDQRRVQTVLELLVDHSRRVGSFFNHFLEDLDEFPDLRQDLPLDLAFEQLVVDLQGQVVGDEGVKGLALWGPVFGLRGQAAGGGRGEGLELLAWPGRSGQVQVQVRVIEALRLVLQALACLFQLLLHDLLLLLPDLLRPALDALCEVEDKLQQRRKSLLVQQVEPGPAELLVVQQRVQNGEVVRLEKAQTMEDAPADGRLEAQVGFELDEQVDEPCIVELHGVDYGGQAFSAHSVQVASVLDEQPGGLDLQGPSVFRPFELFLVVPLPVGADRLAPAAEVVQGAQALGVDDVAVSLLVPQQKLELHERLLGQHFD